MGEELAAAHQSLLARLRELEQENAKLRAAVEADGALRELVRQIERLEKEKQDLATRFHEVETSSSHISERFMEVEKEFSSLANLFVASNQLHASLSPRGVMRRIKEVLAQLVGAESYAIYLATGDSQELVPVASEGIQGESLVPRPATDGLLAEVLRSGRAVVNEEMDPSQGNADRPAAVIPLSVDERVVGVIAIHSTLAQKTRFDTIDYELFNLLGRQAAWALVSASLFSAAGQRLPGLESFIDLSV